MTKSNIRAINIATKEQAKRELAAIGADEYGVKLMAPKAVHRVLCLERVPVVAANIIKQEILSRGGEAAVSRGTVNLTIETTNMLLLGTEKQLRQLCAKLKIQPFGLKKIAAEIIQVLEHLNFQKQRQLHCGDTVLELGQRTMIMGILNITPDSFSDGGRYNILEQAVRRAEEMVAQGADIIDVGAESTRPTATPLGLAEELERVMPVVQDLVKRIKVPISVDTYKAEVARQVLSAGAHIINDVWGAQREPQLAQVVAQYHAPVVVMHNQQGTAYNSLMGDICAFLHRSVNICLEAGVPEKNIIIDPGIGFGKTHEQNLAVMRSLEELHSLGKPILLGTSRKSIVGNTLNLPREQRIEGTAATVALGIAKGVDIVRVHDVKEMARVVKMTDAMVR